MKNPDDTPFLSSRIMNFNREIDFTGKLPKGIRILNPFRDNPQIMDIAELFYSKFYHDKKPRTLILGINPGRLGAGATGIPFTDTKRLETDCGIRIEGLSTHEPSSVFIYQMINAFGGPQQFYRQYFISSICPLGFVSIKNGKWVNHNYYDSAALQRVVKPFAVQSLKKLLSFGINTEKVFCLGTGKNYHFIKQLNEEFQFFGEVIPLEHPRYIMQYKSAHIADYIDKYLKALSKI